MSTNQRPLQRPRRLSLNSEEEKSLQYGDLPDRPGFPSEKERKAAWFATAIGCCALHRRPEAGRLVVLRKYGPARTITTMRRRRCSRRSC